MSEFAILAAVRSFQLGSAGGLDGLRPQHLKDLINTGTGDVGRRSQTFVSTATDFVNICLAGKSNLHHCRNIRWSLAIIIQGRLPDAVEASLFSVVCHYVL